MLMNTEDSYESDFVLVQNRITIALVAYGVLCAAFLGAKTNLPYASYRVIRVTTSIQVRHESLDRTQHCVERIAVLKIILCPHK